MRESGYSEDACLAFDRVALTFVQQYRRMRDATKQEPETLAEKQERRRSKGRVMKTVPKHTEEELLKKLGVVLDENSPEVSQVLSQLDSAMWEAVDWPQPDEEEAPEAE